MNHFGYRDNPNRVDPPEDVFNPYGIETEDKYSHEKLCDELSDSLILWEGMSYDGFTEPHPQATGFFMIRQNAIAREEMEESLKYAFASKDFESIGHIVYNQLQGYAKRVIDFGSE
jgi:hypothetical protein